MVKCPVPNDARIEFEMNGWPRLEACKKCSGLYCCSAIEAHTKIGPPFLTSYDLSRIKNFTGMQTSVFLQTKTNHFTGNKVRFLKTIKGRCIFFDSEQGTCQIHVIRPIDCGLFPLDIRKVGKHYYWILYRYKYCDLSYRDKGILLNFKNEVLPFLLECIPDYATVGPREMSDLQYELLSQISL